MGKMQSVTFCSICKKYFEGTTDYRCPNCGRACAIALTPDDAGGFLIEVMNQGNIYFQDLAEFKSKLNAFNKMLDLANKKNKGATYIG